MTTTNIGYIVRTEGAGQVHQVTLAVGSSVQDRVHNAVASRFRNSITRVVSILDKSVDNCVKDYFNKP